MNTASFTGVRNVHALQIQLSASNLAPGVPDPDLQLQPLIMFATWPYQAHIPD